jgi:hypothetical protein
VLAALGAAAIAIATVATIAYVRNVDAARTEAENALERSVLSEKKAKDDERLASEAQTRAETASAAAKKAETLASDQRADFERQLTSLRAELKKNLNDARALQEIAKRANGLSAETARVLTQPGSASVGATGLPP